MKNRIRQLIKCGLVKTFDLIGIQAEFSRKKSSVYEASFDRQLLKSYFDNNGKIQLYYEGLKKAKMEWSDNFLKQCRFYSLQQIVSYIMSRDISADFVECGCWKGHSSYIISKILYENNFSNSFHIFDSFEGGLSYKSEEDRDQYNEQTEEDILMQKKAFASSEDDLLNTVKEFDFIKTYKGWIPERFPEVEDRKFAFVHIDVDLYQPTRDCLKFFFTRLLSGGVIVVDDYGYTKFPGAKKAVDEFMEGHDDHFFYELPTGGCFIMKNA